MMKSKLFLSGILILIIFGCSGLDDKLLPVDALNHVEFQDVEVNPARNYIRGKLVNNSAYTLTSCKVRISIYLDSPAFAETDEKQAAFSKNFFIRASLKPGYSTEVYYEVKLDGLQDYARFTSELFDLKGQVTD